ncbi:nucleotide exchange factor GrpE [Schaalia sp. ZJ1691]|uniref:nucleotide exchange factor GrpE n=1 Tax=Schaalia sp. ZJ1691 TaxID=2709404 RepID=UPI001F14C639|nr:nucleotide exchange factor GrpE [Schaalia sp. ZJ1691]
MTEADNHGLVPESDDVTASGAGTSGVGSNAEPTPESGGQADSAAHAASSSSPEMPSDGEATDTDGSDAAVDMTSFEEQIEDSDLAKALEKIAQLEDQLAHANADLYNLNQEYANFVRRSKEAIPGHRDTGQNDVMDALISVLDDIDAARQHGDLDDGPFAAIATKLEETLKTRFQMERYGQVGDDFDPMLHDALMANTSADVDHPVIGQVVQPGYKRADHVLRATKVMVNNPE